MKEVKRWAQPIHNEELSKKHGEPAFDIVEVVLASDYDAAIAAKDAEIARLKDFRVTHKELIAEVKRDQVSEAYFKECMELTETAKKQQALVIENLEYLLNTAAANLKADK